MTDNNELAASPEYVPESPRTLAAYLDRSLNNKERIANMVGFANRLGSRFSPSGAAECHQYISAIARLTAIAPRRRPILDESY
jgi:hypothetical protein